MLHISELPGDTDAAGPWVTETCMSLVSNSRAEAVQGPFWMNSCQDDQQGTFWRNPGRFFFLPHTKTTCQEASQGSADLSLTWQSLDRCQYQGGSSCGKAGVPGGVSLTQVCDDGRALGAQDALLSTSSCLCRLRWVQGGDQAWPVAPGSGQAVARQLLQMPDLQHHPHRGVHQQVGFSPSPTRPPGLSMLPDLAAHDLCPSSQQHLPPFPSSYHTLAANSTPPTLGPHAVLPVPQMLFSALHMLAPPFLLVSGPTPPPQRWPHSALFFAFIQANTICNCIFIHVNFLVRLIILATTY